jgi:hypothetical protein
MERGYNEKKRPEFRSAKNPEKVIIADYPRRRPKVSKSFFIDFPPRVRVTSADDSQWTLAQTLC